MLTLIYVSRGEPQTRETHRESDYFEPQRLSFPNHNQVVSVLKHTQSLATALTHFKNIISFYNVHHKVRTRRHLARVGQIMGSFLYTTHCSLLAS